MPRPSKMSSKMIDAGPFILRPKINGNCNSPTSVRTGVSEGTSREPSHRPFQRSGQGELTLHTSTVLVPYILSSRMPSHTRLPEPCCEPPWEPSFSWPRFLLWRDLCLGVGLVNQFRSVKKRAPKLRSFSDPPKTNARDGHPLPTGTMLRTSIGTVVFLAEVFAPA